MKHYKYKREERLNKFEWDLDYSLENLIKDLLSTLSKEEYSQRIMMEQVPKMYKCEICGRYYDDYGKSKNTCEVCRNKIIKSKQDKTIECINCFYYGNKKCPPCSSHYSGFKPTKDTNKTSLEDIKLPDNLFIGTYDGLHPMGNLVDREFWDWIENITEKVNTLISLQKEK